VRGGIDGEQRVFMPDVVEKEEMTRRIDRGGLKRWKTG